MKLNVEIFMVMCTLLVLTNLQRSSCDSTLLLHNKLCGSIYPENATNIILVFINSYGTETDGDSTICYGLDSSSVTEIIQMYYSIDQLNRKFDRFDNTLGRLNKLLFFLI